MKSTPIKQVEGAYVCELDRYPDDRGYFEEIFSLNRNFFEMDVRQVSVSCSKRNVVRGLHVAPFAKLCMCVSGRLFDVVADARSGSPTYLGWFGVWLSPNEPKQLFVPEGCAHGFYAAEDDTVLLYMQGGVYDPKIGTEIHWRDPRLAIDWPQAESYILSPKDEKAEPLT
jgi:dTDP-4-dehydrorhamnose 3,5-epimerase